MKTGRQKWDFSNAGGGTSIVLGYLMLIPGFLPALALTIVPVVAIAVPLLVLTLAAAVVIAPLYGIGRLARRVARRHHRASVQHTTPTPTAA